MFNTETYIAVWYITLEQVKIEFSINEVHKTKKYKANSRNTWSYNLLWPFVQFYWSLYILSFLSYRKEKKAPN